MVNEENYEVRSTKYEGRRAKYEGRSTKGSKDELSVER